MKITNLKRAQQLAVLLKVNNNALESVETILNRYHYDTNGFEASSNNSLYEFYLCLHRDGSGMKVDLTSCKIGIRTLQFVKEELLKEENKLKTEIESL